MVVPPVTLLVPMFVFMVDTGWINHLQSVIIFYTGLLVPFAVFFLANFFRTVPQELIEAAAVEGAGPFTVLRRIVMPLSGAATLHARRRAGDLGVERAADRARLPAERELAHPDGWPHAVPGPLRRRTSRSSLRARSLSILPVVVLYLSGQRFFVRGLTAGIGK